MSATRKSDDVLMGEDWSWFAEYSAIARRKLGAPAGFRVFYARALGSGDILVKGSVPRILTRGPRAGKPSWTGAKPVLECAITRRELIALERARCRA